MPETTTDPGRSARAAVSYRSATPEDLAIADLLVASGAAPDREMGQIEGRWSAVGRQRADELVAGIGAGVTGVVAESRSGIVGAVLARRSDWESDHFGVPIHRSTGLAVATALGSTVARDLALRLMEELRPGPQHDALLIIDQDARAQASSVGLQMAGSRICDSILHFATVPAPVDSLPLSGRIPGIAVHLAGSGSTGALASAAEVDELGEQATGLFRSSHFHADDRLDPAACDDVYRSWVHRAFGGDWADWVLVARDEKDRIASFVAHSVDRSLDGGPVVLRNGFGFAVPPQGRGYTGTLAAIVSAEAPADIVLGSCQAGNVAQVRNFSKHLTFCRASLVHHCWA